MMKRELENALANNERPPASVVTQILGCDSATLRRYFPDLYHSVVVRHREAFLDREARQSVQEKLQEKFAQCDDTLSVSELARWIGYSEDVLSTRYHKYEAL
jgi:hypothetical protein